MPKKIVLLGFGTIGSSVGRIISEDGTNRKASLKKDQQSVSSIADILAELEVVAIVGLETEQISQQINGDERYAALRSAKITDNIDDALALEPDILVELMGGVEPAHKFIAKALSQKVNVVTANQAVLGTHGQELRDLALKNGVELLYEAAVGGAIPIVRAIRHSLMGDKIISITGVLNGTTNFILDKMTHQGMDYDAALKQAQDLGFAEADPSADVDGWDAAAKISILASLAFGRNITVDDVKTEGITKISQGMIIAAQNNHQVYKLVATAKRNGCAEDNHNISLEVKPTLVSEQSAFGELEGSMNAVEVISEYSQKLTFSGLGAGGDPTASAVLADIIEIAQNMV
jgi:homoserine dehydrogenase